MAWWAMLRASIDLPMPLGPMSMPLADSLRKSRDISASTAARSMRAGQPQSKSHSGLKRPMCASCRRRSRLRRARSASSQSSRPATQGSAATSCQWASRPWRRRASARWRRDSNVSMAGLRKLTVRELTVRELTVGLLPGRELVISVEPVVLDGDIRLPGLR